MILVKWYARLHFAQLAPLPEDLKSEQRERTSYNLSNDLFQNSVKERAFQYLFVHFLIETGRMPALQFDKKVHVGSKQATASLTCQER